MKPESYEELSAQLSDLKYELDLWRLQFYFPEDLQDKAEKINRLKEIKDKLNSSEFKSQSQSLESLRKAMIMDIRNTQSLKYYKEMEKKINVVMAIYMMAYSNLYRDINYLKKDLAGILNNISLTFDDFGEILNMNFTNHVDLSEEKHFENEGQLVEYVRVTLRGLYEDLMVDKEEARPFNIYEKIMLVSVLEEVNWVLNNGY